MEPHPIKWLAPSPLWPELAKANNGSGSTEFGGPVILRFATDDFMQDFYNVLATDPRKLGEFRAVRETWRGKLSQPTIPTPKKVFALQMQRLASSIRRPANAGLKPAVLDDAKALGNLKLYQPAHLRYYLVTACLTCQIAGLPDRKVDAGKQERVGFVVRRLFPSTRDGAEHAWVKTATGYAWQRLKTQTQDREDIVLEGEERLPLFPVTLQDDDQRARRLFAGLIPVGKREAYLAAPKVVDPSSPTLPATTAITAKKILLRKDVIEPWKALLRQMNHAGAANATPAKGDKPPVDQQRISTRSAREQAQVVSWLILLDFARWLATNLPELWSAIVKDTAPGAVQPKMAAAFGALKQAALPVALANEVRFEYTDPANDASRQMIYSDVPNTLLAALQKFGNGATGVNAALEQQLESANQPYSRQPNQSRDAWPRFAFPLADPDPTLAPPLPPVPDLGQLDADERQDLLLDAGLANTDPEKQLDQLAVLFARALQETVNAAGMLAPEVPAAARSSEDPLNGLFRLRCVYERPACGPLHDDVVSEPTEPFELAGFFDPDAPARPIRIGLPIDTTPAGLRKFDKNTAFVMSDVLCGQIKRCRGMSFGDLVLSVLPWPFHKDLSGGGDMKPCTDSGGTPIGTICSISIPIITICALILLLIMVTLLDLIFSWVPFLMICFPLPGFKAKKS